MADNLTPLTAESLASLGRPLTLADFNQDGQGYWRIIRGQKTYYPRAWFDANGVFTGTGTQAGDQAGQDQGFFKQGMRWNWQTGEWENPTNWANVIGLAAAGGVGAGIAAPAIAGALGGGAGAGGATAGTLPAVAGGGAATTAATVPASLAATAGGAGLSAATKLGIGALITNTATSLYGQQQQINANATAAQLQAQAAADALAYTKLQGQQAQQNFETTQHANYDQWAAAQQYQNASTAARTQAINALGAKYGVAARDIPSYAIPAYVPSTNVLGPVPGTVGATALGPGAAPAGPAGATGTAGTPAPSATSTPAAAGGTGPANGDYQTWFNSLVAGKPFNQQTLLALEPTLNAAGVQLTPPNAVGDRTKINVPGVGWVRVGFGEGHPVWIPQGTGGATTAPGAPAAVASSALPYTTPYATPMAAPGVSPALTVQPYQRRTIGDYLAG
jgi:hypothetical protein